MADQPTITDVAAIVVAAGKGIRAGQPLPKQFTRWHGKVVLRHSVESFAKAGIAPIVVAIPEDSQELATETLRDIAGIKFVIGGATRQESVRSALEYLASVNPKKVMIHDAARPVIPASVLDRLNTALDAHPGAIPVLPVIDSISIDADGIMSGSADRGTLRRVQTPQAFKFVEILSAHRAWSGETDAGDDAQVLLASGGEVAHIKGDEALRKLTFAEDFMEQHPSIRTGTGFDVHRLVDGEELWLGGVQIDHHQGLSGHSDADVALHAIVDALLGAIAAGDIGDHFPPSDERWEGARSAQFLEHAVSLVEDTGYTVGNVDLTIICEAPKIGPHREAMREKIADLLAVDIGQVSVKATTTERLGFTGRGEGIAAQAVAMVFKQG